MPDDDAPRPDLDQNDPETAAVDEKATGELNQNLDELLAEAGLSESLTVTEPITEGMPDTPEDHQGATGEPQRDEALSHPEDAARYQGPYRLTTLVAEWFEESVARHAQGEQVIWDIGPMSMPDPQQRGMFHPGLAIIFSIKGAVANTIIYNANIEQPFGLNREAVDAWCQRIIEELRQGRSQQLQEMHDQARNAQDSGRSVPSGGIILPGG